MLRRMLPVLVSSWFLCALGTAAPTDPPSNVLVIVLDDVGIDALECYATSPCSAATCTTHCGTSCSCTTTTCDRARTPVLNGLAASGIRFTNVRSAPVCSPGRACLQTGRYPFRHGVGDAISSANPTDVQDSETFLPELLKGALSGTGLPYACGAFGKWHLTTASSPPNPANCADATCSTASGNEWQATNNGYDRFYGTIANHNTSFCWTKIEADGGSSPSIACQDIQGPPYTTAKWDASVNAVDAGTWINEQETAFFAYVAFNPPHTPLQVPPCALMSADTRCELENYSGGPYLPGAQIADTAATALRRLAYRAMLEAVDTEIGKLLAYLDDDAGTATRENTMIFVVGDNGTPGVQINSPFTSAHGKGTIYEGGIRVPLIVSGPLVGSAGAVCDELVDSVDLWRTVAEIGELTGGFADTTIEDYVDSYVADDVDSVSFLSLIVDPTDTGDRTDSFSQQFTPNGIPPQCYQLNERCLVRKSSVDGDYYKLIRRASANTCYRGPCASPPCGGACTTPTACSAATYTEEFFNVSVDPDETTNLLTGTLAGYQTGLRMSMRTAMIDLSGS